uniref:Death domain-containing protein n=1 Tax=Panagrellus redivivus TaxID=6233 RepID=A0A7E4V3Y1_PANRE
MKRLRQNFLLALHFKRIDVIGLPESGKTTLGKVLKSYYGFESIDKKKHTSVIRISLCHVIDCLLHECPIDTDESKIFKANLPTNFRNHEKTKWFGSALMTAIPPLATQLKAVLGDACAQRLACIDDSADYIFEHAEKICDPTYNATENDYLHAKTHTLKCIWTVVEQQALKVYDGGWPTPSTWFKKFPRAAVILTVNATDWNKDHFKEALSMVKQVANATQRTQIPILVVVTKADLVPHLPTFSKPIDVSASASSSIFLTSQRSQLLCVVSWPKSSDCIKVTSACNGIENFSKFCCYVKPLSQDTHCVLSCFSDLFVFIDFLSSAIARSFAPLASFMVPSPFDCVFSFCRKPVAKYPLSKFSYSFRSRLFELATLQESYNIQLADVDQTINFRFVVKKANTVRKMCYNQKENSLYVCTIGDKTIEADQMTLFHAYDLIVLYDVDSSVFSRVLLRQFRCAPCTFRVVNSTIDAAFLTEYCRFYRLLEHPDCILKLELCQITVPNIFKELAKLNMFVYTIGFKKCNINWLYSLLNCEQPCVERVNLLGSFEEIFCNVDADSFERLFTFRDCERPYQLRIIFEPREHAEWIDIKDDLKKILKNNFIECLTGIDPQYPDVEIVTHYERHVFIHKKSTYWSDGYSSFKKTYSDF